MLACLCGYRDVELFIKPSLLSSCLIIASSFTIEATTYICMSHLNLLSIKCTIIFFMIFSMEISPARHDAAKELLDALEIVLDEVSHRTVIYFTILCC